MPAVAATSPSGIAVAVVQQAEANGRVLQQDAPVYSGDAIVTGSVGQAQVKFRDNTKLVVGPNSRLVIDAFIYSGRNTARKLSINALKGAFRFISGNSRHDAYNITTPTATIGVRGTQIDVSVSKGVVIYSGAAEVCKRGSGGRNCVMIRGGCSLATFGPNRNVRKVSSIVSRNQTLLKDFQYAVDQRPLLPEFRANTGSCGVLRAALPVAPGETPPVVVASAPPPPSPPPPVVTPPERCDYHPPRHPPRHWPRRDWPDHHRHDLDHRGGGDGGTHRDRFAGPRVDPQIAPNALNTNDPNARPPGRTGFRWRGSEGPGAKVDFGHAPSRFNAFSRSRRGWGWSRRGTNGFDNRTIGGIGSNTVSRRGGVSRSSSGGAPGGRSVSGGFGNSRGSFGSGAGNSRSGFASGSGSSHSSFSGGGRGGGGDSHSGGGGSHGGGGGGHSGGSHGGGSHGGGSHRGGGHRR